MRHELDADFVQFAHACFGYPAVSTFLNAVKNNWLSTFPRITAKMIAANPPNQVATAQGHLDRTRRSMKTTKIPAPPTSLPPATTELPAEDTDTFDSDFPYVEEEYHNIYVKLLPIQQVSHADITGRFPSISRRGHQYMLLSVWNNYIHIELMKNRTAPEYVRAYSATLVFFASIGHKIDIMRLDNETSADLDNFLRTNLSSVEFVPPGNHRANRAERAWRTTKNHIIATLCGTDPSFPIAEWDETIPQLKITLNTLRPFAANPLLSAYQGAHGHPYDFNSHPIAPFGTKVLIYETPDDRTSWAPHGVLGYYLGPAPSHHRSFRVYTSKTRAERISDSLAWFPTTCKMPGSSTAELLLAQLSDLTATLKTLSSSTHIPVDERTPFAAATASAVESLTEIARVFSPFATILATPPPEQRVAATPAATPADRPQPPPPTRGPPAQQWTAPNITATVPTGIPPQDSQPVPEQRVSGTHRAETASQPQATTRCSPRLSQLLTYRHPPLKGCQRHAIPQSNAPQRRVPTHSPQLTSATNQTR